MARTHAHTHGKSHSIRPTSRDTPWVNTSEEDLTNLILKYYSDGLSPSKIGIELRDKHGIPLVKNVIGKTISKILEENNIRPAMPEDLDNLLKKAIGLQRHLRTHNSDHRNVRSLELVEAKVHRLSKYYKREGKIEKKWKYASVIAQLE